VIDWSAGQYRRFETERTRPAADLLARVTIEGVARVVDLGCGPGNSTELLVDRFPQAEVVGTDLSEDMLAAARKRLRAVTFRRSDIASWQPETPVDLVFANASLQWVPDHATLLPRLLGRLTPGGTLAVQVPDNLDEPSHRLMREVAAAGRWRAALAGAATARTGRQPAGWYHRLLHGRAELDLWRTTYFHPLADVAAIVEWLKGTGLRPYLAPLAEDAAADFLAAYREAIASAYPALPDGSVLLPFPRLFIVATQR
jgi:trans-aconitate 2-methyltransferase